MRFFHPYIGGRVVNYVYIYISKFINLFHSSEQYLLSKGIKTDNLLIIRLKNLYNCYTIFKKLCQKAINKYETFENILLFYNNRNLLNVSHIALLLPQNLILATRKPFNYFLRIFLIIYVVNTFAM